MNVLTVVTAFLYTTLLHD